MATPAGTSCYICIILEYLPVVAWVLSQDGIKFGKEHPMLAIYMAKQIQQYIICHDQGLPLRGDD